MTQNVWVTPIRGVVKSLTPEPPINRYRNTFSHDDYSFSDYSDINMTFATEVPKVNDSDWTESSPRPQSVFVKDPVIMRYRTREGFMLPNYRSGRPGTSKQYYEKPRLYLQSQSHEYSHSPQPQPQRKVKVTSRYLERTPKKDEPTKIPPKKIARHIHIQRRTALLASQPRYIVCLADNTDIEDVRFDFYTVEFNSYVNKFWGDIRYKKRIDKNDLLKNRLYRTLCEDMNENFRPLKPFKNIFTVHGVLVKDLIALDKSWNVLVFSSHSTFRGIKVSAAKSKFSSFAGKANKVKVKKMNYPFAYDIKSKIKIP